MKKVFIAMCLLFVGLCFSVNEKSDTSFGMNLSGVQCLESRGTEACVGVRANSRYKAISSEQSEAAIDYGFPIKSIGVLNLGGSKPFHVVGIFVVNSLVELGDAYPRELIPSDKEVSELLLFSLNTFLLMMIFTITMV